MLEFIGNYWIDALAVIIAGISAYIAYKAEKANRSSAKSAQDSAKSANDSIELNKKIFRLQNVIELHREWSNVHSIDINKPHIPSIVQGKDALLITASFWLHDIIEKDIICQNYWGNYKEIYEALDSNIDIPALRLYPCKKILTTEMQLAYKEMNEKCELGNVKTSSLN